MATAAPAEVSLGVFSFEKETENTKRFSQAVEDGRDKTQYVQKDVLATLGDPEAVEVIVRAAKA